jgi:hypothetical protein
MSTQEVMDEADFEYIENIDKKRK